MRLSACFAILVVAVALSQAGPVPKITEKKSLVEDVKQESTKTDLKIEENGEDKDRAKKSAGTFCVQINPGSTQPTQVSCQGNQAAVQTLAIQAEPVSQQIQTLGMLQPYVHVVPQTGIVMPQPLVPSINTLQIVQPAAQPCAQSIPSVNIIQSDQSIPKPKPKPKPTSTSMVDIKTTTKRPLRIEKLPQSLPEPQETLAMLPIAPACHDHIITIPSNPVVVVPQFDQNQLASIVQVPSVSSSDNPLHNILNPCTCQKNVAVLNEPSVEPMAMQMVPVMSYSSSLAKSPMMMPYNFNMPRTQPLQVETSASVAGMTPRHHHHRQNPSSFQQIVVNGNPETPYNPYPGRGFADMSYGSRGLMINVSPENYNTANTMIQHGQMSLRNHENAMNDPVAYDTNGLAQSNKTPRDTKATKQAPEKTVETKQQGKASLIDGRRSTTNNKEEAKQQEHQTATK
ncbi:uncharacterized protein LOC122399555 [Colletes gigas]|uniref:uncharacterized protein LOC122399555 n=1 Tax=Colletes gigas TaxID=935657 RepID=UPI001C9B3154|nr:uncharacterized protein LOC122399555 [Colletes gigas]